MLIAARKELLMKVDFLNDFGVDIGLLIDVLKINAVVKEVEIGKIPNNIIHHHLHLPFRYTCRGMIRFPSWRTR